MIELIIINSLIIWGVFTSIQEGMIFGYLGYLLRGERQVDFGRTTQRTIHKIPKWIKKPLATCPICMSSVYGTPVFWFAYFTNYLNYDYIIILYICYMFALAGLNYLILSFMPDE